MQKWIIYQPDKVPENVPVVYVRSSSGYYYAMNYLPDHLLGFETVTEWEYNNAIKKMGF